MTTTNGAADVRHLSLAHLREWVIAYTSSGEGYVGRVAVDDWIPNGIVALDPAWLLVGGYQTGPQGIQRPFGILPIEISAGIHLIEVRPCAILRFHDLDPGDLDVLGKAVLQGVAAAEEMRQAIRAQRSGITLAPAGLKLPPLPRRG